MHGSRKIRILSIILILQTLYTSSHCQSGDGPSFRPFGLTTDDADDRFEDDTYAISGSIPVDFVTEKNLDDIYLDLDLESEDSSKTASEKTDKKEDEIDGRTIHIVVDDSSERDTKLTGTTKPKSSTTTVSSDPKTSTGPVVIVTQTIANAGDSAVTGKTGAEIVTSTEVGVGEGKERVKSSKGTIILVIIGAIVLIGTCVLWRVIQLRKKRHISLDSKRRRNNLENYSHKSPVDVEWQSRGDVIRVTNGLLADTEKSPYRELSVARGDDDDVLADINLNRERFGIPKPALSNTNMNTFTAVVTIEGNENNGDLGVTSNPRFSPPPTYAEFLRASREQLDSNKEEQAYFLPNMGPSYR